MIFPLSVSICISISVFMSACLTLLSFPLSQTSVSLFPFYPISFTPQENIISCLPFATPLRIFSHFPSLAHSPPLTTHFIFFHLFRAFPPDLHNFHSFQPGPPFQLLHRSHFHLIACPCVVSLIKKLLSHESSGQITKSLRRIR